MDHPDTGLAFRVTHLMTLINMNANSELLARQEQTGLNLRQLQLLDFLRDKRPTIYQCGKALAIERSHASRTVELLARRGLVTREPDSSGDGRLRRVVITDAGRHLLAELQRPSVDAARRFEQTLTPSQSATLAHAIDNAIGGAA